MLTCILVCPTSAWLHVLTMIRDKLLEKLFNCCSGGHVTTRKFSEMGSHFFVGLFSGLEAGTPYLLVLARNRVFSGTNDVPVLTIFPLDPACRQNSLPPSLFQ